MKIVGCNYFTEGYWIVEYENGFVGMEQHDGAPGPEDTGLTPSDVCYPDDDEVEGRLLSDMEGQAEYDAWLDERVGHR